MTEIFNFEQYKKYLIDYYVYDRDNGEIARNERKNILEARYPDEYLQEIINNTIEFLIQFIENNLGKRYCHIEIVGDEHFVFTNCTGGWPPDTYIPIQLNNQTTMISEHLLNKFLGKSFRIERYTEEFELYEEDDDFGIGYIYAYFYLSIVGDFSLLQDKYEELRNLKQNELITILKRKLNRE